MESRADLAPGVPADYYERLAEAEDSHWWYAGMRDITVALLGARLQRPGQTLLDAGCGTGGFLRFALELGMFEAVAGVDVSRAAIGLARARAGRADLHIAPLSALPFAGASFDLAVAHDVLQHVPEGEIDTSLQELRRVLRPGGTLLVRTNGARHHRRERPDWRVYERATLTDELERAGFRCERVTYANLAGSLVAAARGRTLAAPTEHGHGIPSGREGRLRSAFGLGLLRAEARYLSGAARSLPWGHTLLALAVARDGSRGRDHQSSTMRSPVSADR